MNSGGSKQKVRFILSHPIQYFSPLFRELAKEPDIEFEAWYCSDEGSKPSVDVGFGTTVTWDVPLLEGYTYRFFPNKARRPSIHYGFMGLWNPDLLKAVRTSPRGTVLILHGWNYVTHLMVLLMARFYGQKLIFRGDNPDHHDRMMKPFKRVLKQLVLRPMMALTHRVLYAGKRNFLFFRMYGVSASRLCFAPHSVDNARFRLTEAEKQYKRKEKRALYGIPEEAVVVICPAKYIPKKRLPDLIEAVHLSRNKNIYVVLAGEGPSRAYIENIVAKKLPGRTILTGFVNQTEMPALYAMSDILCLCSGMGETWGLAVNEGMNSNLPLVISHLCGCADDLVQPERNGYIYPCGDVKALSTYIDKLASDPELRSAMGIASGEIVRDFSIEATCAGVIKCIQKIKN